MPKWQRSRPQSHAGFSSVVMWETLSSLTEVMWTGAGEWAGWWYPIENSRGQVKKLLKHCTFSSILFFFFLSSFNTCFWPRYDLCLRDRPKNHEITLGWPLEYQPVAQLSCSCVPQKLMDGLQPKKPKRCCQFPACRKHQPWLLAEVCYSSEDFPQATTMPKVRMQIQMYWSKPEFI